jgi:hypothetical protein
MTDKPITLSDDELFAVWDEHYADVVSFDRPPLDYAFFRAIIAADRASNATAQGMVPDLDGKSTAAYRQYIEAMQRTECLGWEHKVKTGRFGEAELKAHCKAAEYLGMHRAYSDAVNLLAAAPTAAIPAVDAVAGEPVAEPRKRIRLNVSREWLQEKLAQGDDSECGAGFELMPEARAASEGESLKLALEQERQKFQQETRRTSELMVLLRRWVERHVAEHGPGPWARSCDVCALVGESQELLARPINATPPRAGSETTEREAFERDASETWGCALSLERKADGEYSELFAEWAWAGWKARASLSTASALPDVIQERDFWMDRCGELEEQLSQADEADHQVQGVMGAEVRESDQQLMRFYSVETIPALIDAQERHIERLQAKFPPLRDEQPRNPRIG